MKYLLSILFVSISIFIEAQSIDRRAFIFGHSLINHEFNVIPPPGDETKIPHWIYLLAEEAGHQYAAGGQYGFLPQHANLPPISQWGYDLVPPVWDSDTEPFSDADIDHILITAGNFMQWQGPDIPYPGEDGIMTPVSATIDIMDWVETQESGTRVYIYENWPDMAPYLGSGFPPNPTEWTSYNNYTIGAFHDWWIQYQDLLLQARPGLLPRMIPVGPIIVGLLNDTPLSIIPVTELYEDDAPHGLPSIYFLAGLITYMAIYEEPAPLSFTVPPIIHSTVASNYQDVVNYIWNALIDFNDGNGESRVFFSSTVPVEWVDVSAHRQMENVTIRWSVTSEIDVDVYRIQRSVDGINYENIGEIDHSDINGSYQYLDISAPTGIIYYRIREIDLNGNISYSPVVKVNASDQFRSLVYPNPSSGQLTLKIQGHDSEPVNIKVFSMDGSVLYQSDLHMTTGMKMLDLHTLNSGSYIMEVTSPVKLERHRIMIKN